MPLTTSSFWDFGHNASSRLNGRLVMAVTEAKVSLVGYPSRRAFVMAHPVMPLAPGVMDQQQVRSVKHVTVNSPNTRAWLDITTIT